jgi:hypothetical protein
MLQAERRCFKDFSWYEDWQAKARRNPLLRWVQDTRVQVVHQSALATNSWARFKCLFKKGDPRARRPDWDDEYSGPLAFILNPFLCTHYYIKTGLRGRSLT